MKRDDIDCPTNDFKEGEAKGECWGDGHYQCPACIHYRADFKANGQDYIDWMHTRQNGLQFNNLDILQH
jgi:hypothetical protein